MAYAIIIIAATLKWLTLVRIDNWKGLACVLNQLYALLATVYRIVKKFGGKKVWQNSAFETLAKKTLANPRLTCIF